MEIVLTENEYFFLFADMNVGHHWWRKVDVDAWLKYSVLMAQKVSDRCVFVINILPIVRPA